MKILRIDNQGAFNDSVYDNKKELREALKKWSLTEVCEMFDWDYKIITNKQAEQYE